ncbi:MAG TPA: sulfotransferase domain-containing protein, partial [Acidimicrobiia bacterium]
MVIAPAVAYLSDFHDNARWNGFDFRADDIIISTPAKCGTTWMQTICALLVFQTAELDRPLSVISPWFEMLTRPRDEVVADLEAQQHRRFIKSHTPLDGLPWDDRVTYITVARDPRDVAVSIANHDDNFDDDAFARARARTLGAAAGEKAGPSVAAPAPPIDARVRFWEWIGDPTPAPTASSSFQRMLHHLETFWAARERPNV